MKKLILLFFFICSTAGAQTIKRTINNGLLYYEIKDNSGVYLLPIKDDLKLKSEIEQSSAALTEYQEIKIKELQPAAPDKQTLIKKAIATELGGWYEQLELIYNDMINNTTVWKDKRTEIINRYK